jgi:type IV pilus assembly protein PilW
MNRSHTLTRQQLGFSLIELMVSLTIGMVIMLAVVSAYLGAAGAGRTADAIGRMNEDAQMALSILSQQLRMAGVNPTQADRTTVSAGLNPRGNSVPLHNTLTNAFAIRGCDLPFTNVTTGGISTGALNCGHAASSTGPDSISIAYEADRYNTVATGTGTPTDCMGSGITPITATYTQSNGTGTATATIYEAENRFYVGSTTNIVNPTLWCKGSNSTQQPLIENIENLQLSYGTSNPGVTPTRVLGYLSAYEVDTDTTTLTGAAGHWTRWNAVKAVRICVVARSENEVLDNLSSAKYMDCNGVLVTSPPDKRLRRAYTTTVVIRNQ